MNIKNSSWRVTEKTGVLADGHWWDRNFDKGCTGWGLSQESDRGACARPPLRGGAARALGFSGAMGRVDTRDQKDQRDARLRLDQGERVVWGGPARRRSEAMAWRFARLEVERLASPPSLGATAWRFAEKNGVSAKRRHHQAALASGRLGSLGSAWVRLGPLGTGYFSSICFGGPPQGQGTGGLDRMGTLTGVFMVCTLHQV
ncbi:MAG: hypothetical protein JWR26_1790 [Pedosphaera sp.]|nr:hypothetical protein [Pedosphaera sp.]